MASDDENKENEEDEEDVFGDPFANNPSQYTTKSSNESSQKKENTEHSDPGSYSWNIMRLAILKIAQTQMQEFLNVTGIEMQGM